MPFSHHSHSGQFCNHATSSLASILATASAANFHTYAITEHCPRHDEHLYPEEAAAGYSQARLTELFDAFMVEAVRLRDAYAKGQEPAALQGPSDRTGYTQEVASTRRRDPSLPPMKVLIGFETEWIDYKKSSLIVENVMSKHKHNIDYIVGSVHHVRGIPIDFDRANFEKARDVCGSEYLLFQEYFSALHHMVKTMQPKVVGHFDLIRLLSDHPDHNRKPDEDEVIHSLTQSTKGLFSEDPDSENDSALQKDWEILEQIQEILNDIKRYGGMLEINTSALRKGLQQPYPRMEICRMWLDMKGKFVLSDDCHAIAHVGTNYGKLRGFFRELGLGEVAYLERGDEGVVMKTVKLEDFEVMPFFKTLDAETDQFGWRTG